MTARIRRRFRVVKQKSIPPNRKTRDDIAEAMYKMIEEIWSLVVWLVHLSERTCQLTVPAHEIGTMPNSPVSFWSMSLSNVNKLFRFQQERE